MTTQKDIDTLISSVIEQEELRKRLESEKSIIEKQIRDSWTNQRTILNEFGNQHALFKVNDIVTFKKYKQKKRFVVKEVYTRLDTFSKPKPTNLSFEEILNMPTEYYRKPYIGYVLETTNGYGVNGGWSINEDELELYKA